MKKTREEILFSGSIWIEPEKAARWVGVGEDQGVLFASGSTVVWLEKK